jgi:Ni/Fe-hydrogenase subunit HybB-like protein
MSDSTGHLDYRAVDQEVLKTLSAPGRVYYLLLALCVAGILFGTICEILQFTAGMGATGLMHPVMWGVYLITFVFWIGIAHSGTLISAILYLFRARWRTAVARSAEAMTVFALVAAGIFPIIHLGRVWIFYWLIPYPNPMNVWPNFQSPLMFDFVAVNTYLTVSGLFWFTGLIPDLAVVRDRIAGIRRKIYGILSLGWTGSHHQWRHYGWSYLLLAGLATPLVISVHSIVSWDFALAIVPGYHSTIFAPYFVAGAILSGLSMVLTLLIPVRRIFGFQKLIPIVTFESIAKMMIFMSLIIGYSYLVESFMAWYSGNPVEWDTFLWRAIGDYGTQFWMMVLFNAVIPLAFFIKKVRTNLVSLFVVAVLVNIGMWYERFVIIVGSVAHDFNPYAWGIYTPNWVELGIMLGSFSLFFLLFLLFVKVAPAISIAEVKEEVNPPRRRASEEMSAENPQAAGAWEEKTTDRIQRRPGADRKPRVVGVFPFLDDLCACLARVKKTPFRIEDVYSPAPRHEIQEALRSRPSSIRYFTLIGGGLGALLGLALAVYAHVQWNLITGGKPVLAWIPFFVIAFECCILVSVLSTLVGLSIMTRLPRLRLSDAYDARFSQDRFGVVVSCGENEQEAASRILKEAGAEEVRGVPGKA